MKLLVLSVAMAYQFFACAPISVCQESKAPQDRLHFLFPFPESHNVVYNLEASSAQRIFWNAETGDVLRLKGNVEVTMKTCHSVDKRLGKECIKSPVVLRADEVDYNEKTGEIHTYGDVHVALVDPVSKEVSSR